MLPRRLLVSSGRRWCSNATGLPSREELKKLSIKDLKLLAARRKMTTDDCVEKAQIIDKILGKDEEPTKVLKAPKMDSFFTEGEKKGLAYLAAAGVMYILWKIYSSIEPREVKELRAKAAGGDNEAVVALAKALYFGEGVRKNTKEAFELIEKAADAGDAWAQCEAGGMYCRGEGVEQNYKKGFMLFKMAAQQGNRNAMFNLSKLYEVGVGIEPNHTLAEEWRERAKEATDITEEIVPITPPSR